MPPVTWLESLILLHSLRIPPTPGYQEGRCAFHIAMNGRIQTHAWFALMESVYFSHVVSENLKRSGWGVGSTLIPWG